jgi:hypothetical protein
MNPRKSSLFNDGTIQSGQCWLFSPRRGHRQKKKIFSGPGRTCIGLILLEGGAWLTYHRFKREDQKILKIVGGSYFRSTVIDAMVALATTTFLVRLSL